MEREGFVSLWVGHAESDLSLLEYVRIKYSEDGDYLPSQFLKDFNIDIDEFDEDYIERICLNKETHSIEKLINGCSYEDIVIPKFKDLLSEDSFEKFNAGILLYNFQYDNKIKEINNSKNIFRFIGSVEYI